MQDVSGFLKKFSHLLKKKDNLNSVIVGAVKDVTGITLNKKDFNVKRSVLYINLLGSQKSQIFISKNRIIKNINQSVGEVVVTQIR